MLSDLLPVIIDPRLYALFGSWLHGDRNSSNLNHRITSTMLVQVLLGKGFDNDPQSMKLPGRDSTAFAAAWFQAVQEVYKAVNGDVRGFSMSFARDLVNKSGTKDGDGLRDPNPRNCVPNFKLRGSRPGEWAVLTAAAFGIMALAGLTGGDTSKVSMWWLISSYFVITVGELLVSPMGLSMVTKLAPRRMTAMLMGGWFISTSFGNWLSGQVGESLWEEWKHSAFFGLLTVSSLFAAFVLLTQLRRLRAAMPPEGPTEDSRPSDDSAQPAAVTAPLSSPASG